ncbi:hypothetical protein [Desulfosarcina variabilis]|uniref:hypothetical protein n=1 Tax=Desulfosarcina variabilis TaxID=2300 RepID=UPI003AFA9F0F
MKLSIFSGNIVGAPLTGTLANENSCTTNTSANLYAVKMKNYQQLKRFIRDTLGCGCPEEVFNKIEYEKRQDKPWEIRINIGDRLLVYVISADSENDIASKIAIAMESGVTERNEKKFNRFRLVLVTANNQEISNSAEKNFCESKLYDEKTHFHLVTEDDIQAFDYA